MDSLWDVDYACSSCKRELVWGALVFSHKKSIGWTTCGKCGAREVVELGADCHELPDCAYCREEGR